MADSTQAFANAFRRPSIVQELFLVSDSQDIPKNSGVRLFVAARDSQNKAQIAQCQADLGRLVKSIRLMRSDVDAVISSKVEVFRDASAVTRVRFGLEDGVTSDTEAARVSHTNITRGLTKAGFAVDQPREFDSTAGLAGLEEWASNVKLKRTYSYWWLLLLLPLLLLGRGCDASAAPQTPFDIKTKTVIVVLDKSGSMAPHQSSIETQVRKHLAEALLAKPTLLDRATGNTSHYANVIAFTDTAQSFLGEVGEVTENSKKAILTRLQAVSTNGGTNLEAGLQEAAREMRQHLKDTTLVILTDGKDESLNSGPDFAQRVKSAFPTEVQLDVHAWTPVQGPDGRTQWQPADGKLELLTQHLTQR